MPDRTLHILLLRHGQTDANANGVLQGHQPVPLNALGIRQAQRLADRLVGFRPSIDVLISSDLARASQTAAVIAATCRLNTRFDSAWRERSFGLLEGKPVGTRDTWRAASGEIDPPGAEPKPTFRSRVHQALQALPEKYPRANVVAVVTHGGPIRIILSLLNENLLPRPANHPPVEAVDILNCGILHLLCYETRGRCRWAVDCVNEAAHLRDEQTSADAG